MSTTVHFTLTATEADMVQLARQLAPAIRPDMRLYLQGELGAGKTTLVRAMLLALGHRGRVKSPTYGLIEPYHLPLGKAYHLDLYRLSDPEELDYLGFRDLLAEQSLLLIEWPERGGAMLPAPDLAIRLSHLDQTRELELVGYSPAGRASIEVAMLFNVFK